eukprot:g23130.t1
MGNTCWQSCCHKHASLHIIDKVVNVVIGSSLRLGDLTPTNLESLDRSRKAVEKWDEAPWPDFPLARDLCQKLLAFSLEERMKDCDEALNHPWLKEG